MVDFGRMIGTLVDAEVEFIIVGGIAAVAHGSSRVTQDLDLVYARNRGNLERLVAALEGHSPYLRGAPPGLPFVLDVDTLRLGLNFTLTTDMGPIDLLGEITGGGGFEALVDHSIGLDVFGHRCLCLDLETLIRVKRAAGRPRDIEAIAELESIRNGSE